MTSKLLPSARALQVSRGIGGLKSLSACLSRKRVGTPCTLADHRWEAPWGDRWSWQGRSRGAVPGQALGLGGRVDQSIDRVPCRHPWPCVLSGALLFRPKVLAPRRAAVPEPPPPPPRAAGAPPPRPLQTEVRWLSGTTRNKTEPAQLPTAWGRASVPSSRIHMSHASHRASSHECV